MASKHTIVEQDSRYQPDKLRCFAVEVGGYYYALMMTAVMKLPRKGRSPLMSDLVVVLNYRGNSPPKTLDIFESRDRMRLHFGQWGGKELMTWCTCDEKFERSKLIALGEIAPKANDPLECPSVASWPALLAILELVSKLPTVESAG